MSVNSMGFIEHVDFQEEHEPFPQGQHVSLYKGRMLSSMDVSGFPTIVEIYDMIVLLEITSCQLIRKYN